MTESIAETSKNQKIIFNNEFIDKIIVDIEAANNSGIDSALALYGYIDKKDASILKPTSKINQIEDLIYFF